MNTEKAKVTSSLNERGGMLCRKKRNNRWMRQPSNLPIMNTETVHIHIKALFSFMSRQMIYILEGIWRQNDVVSTPMHCIDVDTTSY